MVTWSGKQWILLAAAAAVAAMAWLLLKPDDERKIRRVFDKVAAVAEQGADEGLVAMALKARSLEPLLDDACTVSVPGSPLGGTYAPPQLAATCAQAKAMFRTCALSFYDLRLEFPDQDRAHAVFTAKLSGTLGSGETVSEAQEMEATLVRKDGAWVFRALSVVETLTK